MTEQETFRLYCQQQWTEPHWDTKKVFLALTEDGDLANFITRELGMREDYFTQEQEDDLKGFVERMLSQFVIPVRIRVHRIDFTVLTLKLLLSLSDEIYEYKALRANVTDWNKTIKKKGFR